jgi:multidrug efflux pump subunit AcrB
VERVLIRLGETSIDTDKGGHLAQIQVELRDAELRSVTSDEVLAVWEKSTKIKPGVKSISFARLEKGVGGKELDIRLVGESWQQLEQASRSLMKELTQVAGVSNLETDLRPGKHELIVEVNPEGSRLGLTSANLAEQVRAAFLGVIVQRFQEEGEETVVRVIYQEQERQSIENLRNLTISIIGKEGRIIRTPLLQVATIQQEQGFSQLNHLDRQRAVAVTGEIDERITTAGKVMALLTPTLKEKIPKLFPGVMVRIEGQRATQRETFDSLLFGAGIGLMLILSILALVMDSWSGPFFILSIIPTGIIGMIFGHWVMGYNLTVLSIMAGVAMGGVGVNDSIIFMEFFVKERLSTDTEEALITTVKRRFRPILITTVTTVAGLLPMLMETSIQAQFLIPMAITLSFGLITGTIGTLVVLPSLIMIFDDIRS